MLDINYIRDNKDLVAKAATDKGASVSIDELLQLDDQRRQLIGRSDELRSERNKISNGMKGGRPSDEDIAKVKALKEELASVEEDLAGVEIKYRPMLNSVPNIPSEDTPVGSSEQENKVLKTVGDKTEFNFTPKPHWEMTKYIEQERAAKISGARFAYVKEGAALLQMALMNWGVNQLTDESVIKTIVEESGLDVSVKPFIPVLPPVMMRTDPYIATSRLKQDGETFRLNDDDLWLIGSAEHSLCAYYMNDTIAEELPVRMVGYSPSFRREVGSAGQDTRGILRVHQFNKLEMETFSTSEGSRKEHEFMIAVQEHLMKELELPYQLVLKCTFDMGGPNVRGVDVETWMPGQSKYRETHSADLIGDYQARGLNTKYVNQDGKKELAHTNDATALADRVLIAILENYQNEDGSIKVPAVLRPYMNGRETI